MKWFKQFSNFRNVLAYPRHALVPSAAFLLHAIHILIDCRQKHNDERLLLLPSFGSLGHSRCDALGVLRNFHRTCRSQSKKIQSKHLIAVKHVAFLEKGNTFYSYFKHLKFLFLFGRPRTSKTRFMPPQSSPQTVYRLKIRVANFFVDLHFHIFFSDRIFMRRHFDQNRWVSVLDDGALAARIQCSTISCKSRRGAEDLFSPPQTLRCQKYSNWFRTLREEESQEFETFTISSLSVATLLTSFHRIVVAFIT
jgi:hypothetical protein